MAEEQPVKIDFTGFSDLSSVSKVPNENMESGKDGRTTPFMIASCDNQLGLFKPYPEETIQCWREGSRLWGDAQSIRFQNEVGMVTFFLLYVVIFLIGRGDLKKYGDDRWREFGTNGKNSVDVMGP